MTAPLAPDELRTVLDWLTAEAAAMAKPLRRPRTLASARIDRNPGATSIVHQAERAELAKVNLGRTRRAARAQDALTKAEQALEDTDLAEATRLAVSAQEALGITSPAPMPDATAKVLRARAQRIDRGARTSQRGRGRVGQAVDDWRATHGRD